ncbi:hypothetical protein H3N34_03975 [Photobacterium damselae subsp. damselae]|uniref:hypothetical protein n=1 Tax=Photobacterium damselae TaxID=38293 RepID=UPI001593382E|nr:hypothetical protein [Photobacterium damselae]MBA5682375.1 hypothetical protein [Photobacterium damselae subsp. damselae]NVH52347.1 hypothetical protein [Photobacterium damselae subsp. damselae]NVO82855.1 hypothetical protein [Photobacterium damselae subsp. damselae]
MKNHTKTTLAVTITLAITGCGGSDGVNGGGNGGDTSGVTVKGRAIDGYIQGATAFLDYNFNGVKDGSEPSSITDADGNYEFQLTRADTDCADYAPTVIHVPVGAIDSDLGPVTEAYTLVHPPKFATSSNEEIQNSTPITTAIWSVIQQELIRMGDVKDFKTCADVKNNFTAREQIKERVAHQEFNFANRYGVESHVLYQDFIRSGNAQLHEEAMAIVPALQRSYTDTVALEDAHPNADIAWVSYYMPDNQTAVQLRDSGNDWHRETYVQSKQSAMVFNYLRSMDVVSNDFSTVIENIHYEETFSDESDNVRYQMTREMLTGGYCMLTETIMQNLETASYGVANQGGQQAASFEECKALKVADVITTRQVNTENRQFGYSSTHVYDAYDLLAGHDLIDRQADYKAITLEDLNQFNYIPTEFSDIGAYGAITWNRSLHEYLADGYRYTTKYHDGRWDRLTMKNSGVQINECSNDGVNWASCNF